MRFSTVLLGFALFALCAEVLGHSYVTKPTSRSNQRESVTGCRGPTCYGPCDRPKASITRAPIVAARGDSVKVEWPRNNHAGGFIRLAWAPTDQSDSHTAFDANVQQISCHETGGCSPDDANSPNGGDSGPTDGSTRACSTTIKVPGHLTDGKWTLQWAWFGGAFALGDYYSCVDYQISGGDSVAKGAPSFRGGDFSYPNQQKCKYFNTDRLHACKDEPCTTAPYSGERSGAPYMTAQAPATQAPATQAPATQAPATQAPATQAPATKAPTQAPATQAPTSAPGGSSSNCAGLKTKSNSKAEITTINTWSKTVQMVVQITVAETRLPNWYLVVDFPSSAGTVSVKQVYNAGKTSCENNGQVVFKPAASWAQNLAAGTVINIEFQATYTGNSLSESTFRKTTSAKVYSA